MKQRYAEGKRKDKHEEFEEEFVQECVQACAKCGEPTGQLVNVSVQPDSSNSSMALMKCVPKLRPNPKKLHRTHHH